MKKTNSMKLQFVSRSANEGFARTAVSGFLASLDPTVEELADIKTAVSEAVTNCIVHAYADRIGIVYIAADLYADGRVVIRIRIRAAAFPMWKRPWNRCSPPAGRTGPDWALR